MTIYLKALFLKGRKRIKKHLRKKMQNKTDQGRIKRRQRTLPSNWNAHCTETSHRYIKIHTWLRGLGYKTKC